MKTLKDIPRWQDEYERMPMFAAAKFMQDEIDALRALAQAAPASPASAPVSQQAGVPKGGVLHQWARTAMCQAATVLTNMGDARRRSIDAEDVKLIQDRLEEFNRAFSETGLLSAAPLPPVVARKVLIEPPTADVAKYANALALAKDFHERYERLAPSLDYSTRTETREFDPESPNGRLMVAVCSEILRDAARLPGTNGSGVGEPEDASRADEDWFFHPNDD